MIRKFMPVALLLGVSACSDLTGPEELARVTEICLGESMTLHNEVAGTGGLDSLVICVTVDPRSQHLIDYTSP